MDYIRKLPLLMGLTGAIITGLVGYTHRVSNNHNIVKMMLAMVVFYIIGLMLRGTIIDIVNTHAAKELERKQEKERLEIEKKKAEKATKSKAASGSTVDLAADDELELGAEDEFSELPVSDYLKAELKE